MATGALEVGHWRTNKDWHLSAFDTNGQCRVRFLVSLQEAPRLALFDAQGQAIVGADEGR